MLKNLGLHHEVLFGVEAQYLLGGCNFVGTQLGAVDATGVLLGGGRVADNGAQLDEGGLIGDLGCSDDSIVESFDVFLVVAASGPIDLGNVPAVGLVTGCDILGEGDVGVIFDGDVVAVVDDDQVAQLLVAGQSGRLGGYPLLHIALRGNGEDGVVKGGGAGGSFGVEEATHATLGVGKAHSGRQALA